ncbi:hypothetical protein MIND_01134000 [Mycena indigotica]|uniref:Uncharacterized protein n=1 Tax=Mycena indigotica TaxID=2126181 RepID=A0A8H6S5M9_9AGAR|nr:uncharacterized protein MIND_01134000 [Mycena indigotica]KAF7293555.1 hypothetical protein MIND_01134000 [Mycena indigotica]
MNLSSASPVPIKYGLHSLLSTGLNRPFPLAAGISYEQKEVPDPELAVAGIGTIGIPLEEADALALISSATADWLGAQAVNETPRSPSEIFNSPGPGTWEIPAYKISVANSGFLDWLQDVSGPETLNCIGAWKRSGRVQYVLKCLVIHETSQLASRTIKPSSNKLGELVVILPCSYSDGNLAHAHLEEVFQLEPPVTNTDRRKQTYSVISAHAGVCEIVSPVTAGFRVSLLYDILQDGYLPSRLPSLDSPKQRLRHLLSPWATLQVVSTWSYPHSLLGCLLKHNYTQSAAFDSSSLSGTSDELLFKLFDIIARELSFDIFFGQIELLVRSEVSGKLNQQFWRSEMEKAIITAIFDVNGIPVVVEGLEQGLIPQEDLVIQDGIHLQQAIAVACAEKTQMFSRYRHTVLLLGPCNSKGLTVKVTDKIFEYAQEILGDSQTMTPSRKEKAVFDALLSWCERQLQCNKDSDALVLPARLLQKCSRQWWDLELFFRAALACGCDQSIAVWGPEGYASAYLEFGWLDAIQNLCEATLINDNCKLQKWGLIACLREKAMLNGDIQLEAWCGNHQSRLLSLLAEVKPSDTPWLMSLCMSKGGKFLRNVIYPHLVSQWLPIEAFWIPFMRGLHEHRARIPYLEDPKAVYDVIELAIQYVTAVLPPFPTKFVGDEEVQDVNIVAELMCCCLEIDHGTSICVALTSKMHDVATRGEWPNPSPWPYYDVMVDILRKHYAEEDCEYHSLWYRQFFQDATIFLLSPYSVAGKRMVFPWEFTETTLVKVVDVIARAGGMPFLGSLLLVQPHLLHGRDSDSLKAFAKTILSKFSVVGGCEFKVVKDFLLDAAMSAVDLEIMKSDKVTDNIKFCLEHNASAPTYERFLLRVAMIPPGMANDIYVLEVLVPTLVSLQRVLGSYGLSLESPAFQRFAQNVIVLFTRCATYIPAQYLQTIQIGCFRASCADCPALRNFLLAEDQHGSTTFQRKDKLRRHIIAGLKSARLDQLGVTWETLTTSSPYVLKVHKPSNLLQEAVSPGRRLQGVALLTLLGNREAQKNILEDNFARVWATFDVVNTVGK